MFGLPASALTDAYLENLDGVSRESEKGGSNGSEQDPSPAASAAAPKERWSVLWELSSGERVLMRDAGGQGIDIRRFVQQRCEWGAKRRRSGHVNARDDGCCCRTRLGVSPAHRGRRSWHIDKCWSDLWRRPDTCLGRCPSSSSLHTMAVPHPSLRLNTRP